MSTSRFEGFPEPDRPPLRVGKQIEIPDDFSEEDRLFAQELEGLFCPSNEEIPPFFAHTLLESNDPRFQPASDGLEYKVRASVLRRLHLKRRLFRSSRPTLSSLIKAPLKLRRPLQGLLVTCLLSMLVSMVMSAPSFASGLNILWSGTHSGVVQVQKYPLASKPAKRQEADPADTTNHPRQMSLLEAQRALTFPFYWPLAIPDNYSLDGVYLYQGVAQQWADGPLVDMEYTFSLPGVAPHGSGKITICEFKPKGNVFQVVQLGSSQQMQIDSDGNAAIFVDGQWEQINNTHSWVYGGAGELIYEHNGIIFWIAGDQRDGITKDVLLSIAQSLQSFDLQHMMAMMKHVGIVAESGEDDDWIFAREVLYINNPSGSFMSIVGDDSSSTKDRTNNP